MPSVEELEAQLAEARAQEQRVVTNSVPQERTLPRREDGTIGDGDPYAVTAWGAAEYDFVTPSGQRCRLKKIDVTELAQAGILDRVTRLPGVAGEVVAVAQGQPPAKEQETIDPETLVTVVELLNTLVPLIVVRPQVHPLPAEGDERVPGRIYVDSIEVTDRIAIMNRALGGLAKLDSFRQ